MIEYVTYETLSTYTKANYKKLTKLSGRAFIGGYIEHINDGYPFAVLVIDLQRNKHVLDDCLDIKDALIFIENYLKATTEGLKNEKF